MNTTAFILILFAHVGLGGSGNSNALAVQEFSSQQRCEAAGQAARKLAAGTVKEIVFTCVAK